MKKEIKRFETARDGSALIMTVVLTVLLAIVAVMFVAVARMDVASTSNIADNKMLDSAAKSIVAIISKELVLDTPGVVPTQEYYDYADDCDPWLASLQPYFDDVNALDPNDDTYCWHQISDVTENKSLDRHDVSIGNTTIDDYSDIKLNPDGSLQSQLADADGDGIGDAKWIELENLCSSKGMPIYAAIRVIDNCGMVNINTAHTFDAAGSIDKIDGSSQMQINLKGLLKPGDSITTLHNARCGSASQVWTDYNDNVIWQYDFPYDDTTGNNYLPFDISDELELRYRYCIDSKFKSRFEKKLPKTRNVFGDPGSLYHDPGISGNWGYDDWGFRITEPNDPNDPNDSNADRRHLLTTYNYDRIIDPNGDRMVNINTADVNSLYTAIRKGVLAANSSFPDVNKVSAQIAVNIIDYRDKDPNVAVLNVDDVNYYGFESQPFISEVAAKIDATNPDVPANNFYAVELYNPFNIPIDLGTGGFVLETVDAFSGTTDVNIPLTGTIAANGFFVISNDLTKFTIDPAALKQQDGNLELSDNYIDNLPPGGDGTFDSWSNYNLILKRAVGPNEVILDVNNTVNGNFAQSSNFSAERDPNNWHIVYQVMNDTSGGPNTLGAKNSAVIAGLTNYNLYMKNGSFVTIGDIARPLKIGPNTVPAGTLPADTVGQQLAAASLTLNPEPPVRMNLVDPNYQKIFNYLTVFDPANPPYNHPATEMRVKGRINLNTAPWYVIAQLPWVSLRNDPAGYDDPNLAKAIVAYRDATGITGGPDYSGRPGVDGIAGIGELNKIIGGNDPYRIDYYSTASMAGDQAGFPDLDSPSGDGALDDFEERDLIFSRISNLVTVRSDVFTAYILVRIGADGPQKRYMAILDRSQTTADNRKVKIISFHPVPPAR